MSKLKRELEPQRAQITAKISNKMVLGILVTTFLESTVFPQK